MRIMMKILKTTCIVVMVMKHRYVLLKKNMTSSWMLMKYSCRKMMRGCQHKENITKQGCKMPSCNSRNSIILETKRRLKILPKKLRIKSLLQVNLKETLLKNMLWTKKTRRKNPIRKYLKQGRRWSSKK
jgi:hypothetical protein